MPSPEASKIPQQLDKLTPDELREKIATTEGRIVQLEGDPFRTSYTTNTELRACRQRLKDLNNVLESRG